MKKNASEIMRVRRIIDGDKLDAKDEFFELLTIDLDSLLRDYFDYEGYPRVNIVKENGVFKTQITFTAERLKNFNSIPNP